MFRASKSLSKYELIDGCQELEIFFQTTNLATFVE